MRKIIVTIIIIFTVPKITIITAQTPAGGSYVHVPGVPLLIYKTKKDYRHLVPVILSGDKTHIVSYPDPKDLKVGNAYTLPLLLHKGYLLDNRGINQNVAFLKWTYEEYAAFKQAPPIDEIYNSIIDKAPLTKLYNCGLKQDKRNTIKHLNNLIDKKQLQANCSI
jgi:hypothetical protein